VVLAYPLGYAIFRQRHAALLTLAMFSVHERLIWYSQDARPYSLALLCTMLSFLCYLSLLKKQSSAWRVGYVLSTAGAYYAHYLFGFIAIFHIFHLFFAHGWSRLRSRAWLLTFFGLFIVLLPSLPQLVSLFQRRETLNWVPSNRVSSLDVMSILIDAPLLSVLALVVFCIGVSVGGYRLPYNRDRMHLVLTWFLVPIAMISLIPPLFGVTLFHGRYVLLALPAAIILMTSVMALAPESGWRGWIPLIVFISLSVIWHLLPSFEKSGVFSERPNQGWAQAMALLNSKGLDGDTILYRTGFVEANQLTVPHPDPLLVSFIQSPLTANLPSGRTYSLIGLPFTLDDHTISYVSSAVRQAAQNQRVWVIADKNVLNRVEEALTNGYRFGRVAGASFGVVHVMLLVRSGMALPLDENSLRTD
jgi:hypothetical protein